MISPVFAIVKKDMRSFLTSPACYALIGFCSCIWGIFFIFQVYGFVLKSFQFSLGKVNAGINIHQDLVAGYLVFVYFMLVFVIAALSLKFFTEEKKIKTFSILLTSPTASWQIVLAKWLVGVCFLTILLFISAIYPLSLFFFIKIPMKLFLFGYFGVFLILCVSMTAGLLASVCTDSLIISVVLTMIFSVLLLLLGMGREFTDMRIWQDFFGFLSFHYHFDFFRKGVLNVSSIFYFLSWSFLLGFTTERLVEFHRWQ